MKEMTLERLLEEFRSYELAEALRKRGDPKSGTKSDRIWLLRRLVEPNPYEYETDPDGIRRRDLWTAERGDEGSHTAVELLELFTKASLARVCSRVGVESGEVSAMATTLAQGLVSGRPVPFDWSTVPDSERGIGIYHYSGHGQGSEWNVPTTTTAVYAFVFIGIMTLAVAANVFTGFRLWPVLGFLFFFGTFLAAAPLMGLISATVKPASLSWLLIIAVAVAGFGGCYVGSTSMGTSACDGLNNYEKRQCESYGDRAGP